MCVWMRVCMSCVCRVSVDSGDAVPSILSLAKFRSLIRRIFFSFPSVYKGILKKTLEPIKSITGWSEKVLSFFLKKNWVSLSPFPEFFLTRRKVPVLNWNHFHLCHHPYFCSLCHFQLLPWIWLVLGIRPFLCWNLYWKKLCDKKQTNKLKKKNSDQLDWVSIGLKALTTIAGLVNLCRSAMGTTGVFPVIPFFFLNFLVLTFSYLSPNHTLGKNRLTFLYSLQSRLPSCLLPFSLFVLSSFQADWFQAFFFT